MGKMWKKLCTLTGLFALLMFSPRGLLADRGNGAPTRTEIGASKDNKTLKLKASSAGNPRNASFASTATEIGAANKSSGNGNGRGNIVLANETTGKAESIPLVGSTAKNEALNSGNETGNGIAEEGSSAADPVCVSVIVPVYNVAPYLDKCLDSLVNQTLRNIEIICVNDGSTDESGDILAKWAARDPRIRIITQENQGSGCARNNGIRAAKGEYMAFIDSDDWVSRDFYEKLYGAAKKEDADIAAGNAVRWYSDERQDRRIHKYVHQFHKSVISDFVEKQSIIRACSCWNKVYRREFIVKNNIIFAPKNKVGQDVPFTFTATVAADKIAFDSTVTYFYRAHREGSAMNRSKEGRIPFYMFDNHRRCLDFIEQIAFPSSEKENIRKFTESWTVEGLHNWLGCVSEQYKEEFFEKYKAIVGGFDLTDNPYANDRVRRIGKAVKESSSYAEFSAKMNQKPSHNRILHRRLSVQGQREPNTAKQRQSSAKARIIGKINRGNPQPHH
ncbi:MAG: glycosyltransferase [Puniceicoccales bacterium]|jgi:glycosyltransferase involved in cell wall biosynthesis|nr:glycosyltransferase [Puniceicoccales bacterium]